MILVEQNVLGLEVAMYDILGMDVLDALKDLAHNGACLLLGERNHGGQIVEELALGTELEYEENKCI